VIKPPVWTREVPWYLFAGGLGGASAALAYGAGLAGNRELARRAWLCSLAGLGASPPLLIADLGRPERVLNMLRVFKVTSPMSVGSWLLSGAGAATGLAAAHELLGWFPRAGRAAKPAAAVLGLPVATYTGALLSNTAVPAWYESRRELPFLFAASAAASAGAAASIATPARYSGPARRLAALGVVATGVAGELMSRRVATLGDPYKQGAAGRFRHAAQALTAAGALVTARAGARRVPAAAGGALTLAGAICERWMVFSAGRESATDPAQTIRPQRERLAAA
jgi:Polysulphide reductase, NrfD